MHARLSATGLMVWFVVVSGWPLGASVSHAGNEPGLKAPTRVQRLYRRLAHEEWTRTTVLGSAGVVGSLLTHWAAYKLGYPSAPGLTAAMGYTANRVASHLLFPTHRRRHDEFYWVRKSIRRSPHLVAGQKVVLQARLRELRRVADAHSSGVLSVREHTMGLLAAVLAGQLTHGLVDSESMQTRIQTLVGRGLHSLVGQSGGLAGQFVGWFTSASSELRQASVEVAKISLMAEGKRPYEPPPKSNHLF